MAGLSFREHQPGLTMAREIGWSSMPHHVAIEMFDKLCADI